MLGNVINLIQGKVPAFPRFPVNYTIPSIPKLPFLDPITSTILPLDILDPSVKVGIAEPQPEKPIEKQAARLLVIRKRKMKKHQLRKLRKRMLIQWAHRRLIREQRKEKVFQAELLAQIKEAEIFDPEKWVNDFIERSNRHAKLKEREAYYATPEGLRVKLKLINEKKRIKPADWKD
uniref:Ribosomal protein mS38 C-terminal domain-containing protein n=1 Tax=Strigamia maritima TaxID=126957 RepID=T1IJ51_STRMM